MMDGNHVCCLIFNAIDGRVHLLFVLICEKFTKNKSHKPKIVKSCTIFENGILTTTWTKTTCA